MQATTLPDAISQVLIRIYGHINKQPLHENVSLVGGQMGYALFEAYYQQHVEVDENSRFWERVAASLQGIQEAKLGPAFIAGISGVAWAFLHLDQQGFLADNELDAEAIVEELDEGLFAVSMQWLQEGNFDYLHGGLGACLYFLERTPSGRITRYMEQLIEQLARIAVRLPNGEITWKFLNFNQYTLQTATVYNLSLSHGTAGIVSILSLIYEAGYARAGCRELITGTLQWMSRVRNQMGASIFPNTVTDWPVDQDSRLGWCYGDMGIANAFWLAGEKLRHRAWREIAVETMLKAVPRRGEETKIRDAGMCHGSAGVMYMFRRFSARTGDERFSEAADYWLQRTLQYAQSDTSEAVFLSYVGETGEYESSLSLLSGEISIGLALLAELGAPLDWDRFLLLS